MPLSPSLSPSKKNLRELGLARRAKFESKAAAAFAQHLAAEGLALARQLQPDVISAYYPLAKEPSTLPLLERLAAAGFKTALPITANSERRLSSGYGALASRR